MKRVARVVLMVAAAIAIVALLFLVVFPWFDRTFMTDPVVGVHAPWSSRAR